MREITLDTETTGLDPFAGHRIVEIGCVEMVNKSRTGRIFHAYLNPQRDVPEEATRVHGLTAEFLRDKPQFAQVVEEFLAFIGDAPLVIHNAAFDMKFLNYELEQQRKPVILPERAVDTLLLARKKFPGSPASLDALCRRFEIDLSARNFHGALLDAELLSEVYVELCGGRQVMLSLEVQANDSAGQEHAARFTPVSIPRRVFEVAEEEAARHEALVAELKNPLWKKETAA